MNKKGVKDLLKLRQKIRKELKIEDEEAEESEKESEGEDFYKVSNTSMNVKV